MARQPKQLGLFDKPERIRDYQKEYQARQERARKAGFKGYSEQRHARELVSKPIDVALKLARNKKEVSDIWAAFRVRYKMIFIG